ncbi:hypothetical protein [Actinacidiphila sp. bgisy167]|uniref:hypothetical protein n=1 Tax=Actinacidiphila sp. bgisy167 TaxID=3413797 RepID=UPI003D70F25C
MDDLVEDALDHDTRPRRARRPLWVEEPVGRPRLPDPVREAAVRAWLSVSLALIASVIAALGTVGGSWLAAPALFLAITFTVLSTWAVLDVWITRQVWNQRNGVVSSPSSAARRLRRELRRERRQARSEAREADRRRHLPGTRTA